MIAGLPNHLWQSTLCGAAVAMLAALLRHNSAAARYRLWLCASLKFLVPFSPLLALGVRLSPSVPQAAVLSYSPVMINATVERLAAPTGVALPNAVAEASTSPVGWLVVGACLTWAVGALVVVLMRWRGWQRVRAAVRNSRQVDLYEHVGVPVRSSPALLERGVVGIWRPVLLLPAGIEQHLSSSELRAILAHELSHVTRRDNLTAALHMLTEALFWFHPLVWWIGGRLLDEREQACDEAVLRAGIQPCEYAAGIVSVCRFYVESPVTCVAGVSGSDVTRRIQAILANNRSRDLGALKRAVLGAAAAVAIVLPVAAGVVAAQPAPAFDVASIRNCGDADWMSSHPDAQIKRIDTSRHHVVFDCATPQTLINLAYARRGGLRLNDNDLDRQVRGGPGWIRSDRYSIEANSSVDLSADLMARMLQRLLEDRFRLRIGHGDEQIPM
jgi:beta-lactamase regulating signal transducer with metallopeptidase domain